MTFIHAIVPAVLALLCAGHAAAQTVSFDIFKAGMTPQQAMEAAPGLRWQKTYNSRGDELWWADARSAVSFAGSVWNVQAGSARGQGGAQLAEGQINFKREFPARRAEECLPALSAVIAEIEPVFGAFGEHPEFSDLKSARYYSPGDKYKLSKIGASSLVRDSGQFGDLRTWDTFREPHGDRIRVHVSVDWSKAERMCELRLSQWIVNGEGS